MPVFDWLYIRKELVICDLLLVICDFFWIRLGGMQFEQVRRMLCLKLLPMSFNLEARMTPAVFVENLIKENRELACILGASIRTAQAKASQINK